MLVAILTTTIVATSFVQRSQATTISERAGKTIIAGLVKNEFYEFTDDELIEEGFLEENIGVSAQLKYQNNLTLVGSSPKATLDKEEETLSSLANRTGELVFKPDIATTKISKKARKEEIKYIVQSGDSISTIAEEFEISVNTILWENNLSSYSLIRPGDELIILPKSGITHKVAKGDTLNSIAKKYDVEVAEITKENKMTDSSKLVIGKILFITGGVKPYYAPVKKTIAYNPISVIKDIVKPKNASIVPANKMAWPTEGSRITQYYSWRHHGLDIGNKTGTPLYAADTGTITYRGWSKGYGYRIDIDHGGGKKTRYAHLSKFFVEKGQKVGKGETIGAMGSTGWSTGPHLHFEVIISGKKYNPLNYLR